MLRNKIVRFKKIYQFSFARFLIKCIVFVIIVINTIKNQKESTGGSGGSRRFRGSIPEQVPMEIF